MRDLFPEEDDKIRIWLEDASNIPRDCSYTLRQLGLPPSGRTISTLPDVQSADSIGHHPTSKTSERNTPPQNERCCSIHQFSKDSHSSRALFNLLLIGETPI